MNDQTAYRRCERAIAELKACQARELETYGETGIQEVKEMENEAPAPPPCVDHYNEVLEALLAYGGSSDEFELGDSDEGIRKTLQARRRA